ncbi:MAG: sterol desaturase family protein [Aureispira sp.]|nr:sterol desaturase family protein [Aureispira sp.]
MFLIIITLSILSLSLLLGFCYSYILMYTNWFKNAKIRKKQLEPALSRKEFGKRVPLIIFNLVALYLLSIVGLYLGQGLFAMNGTTLAIAIVHFAVILFIDDFAFYWIHRIMHENKFLHQKIHSVHHSTAQSFPLDFIYAHPVEWLLGYAGAFLSVILIASFSPVNVYAFWVWCAFRSIHELDIHSGVKSNWSKHIPLLAKAEEHDKHHLKSKGNYASALTLWDRVLGTKL